MRPEFEPIFQRLREILKRHAGNLSVRGDRPDYYGLAGGVGPAALKAWGGKMKKPIMPVAWVQIGKGYVSYHLMGVYGNPKLLDGVSKELKARMQGKSCFNFKSQDEALFKELEKLTKQAIDGFKNAGFVSDARRGR